MQKCIMRDISWDYYRSFLAVLREGTLSGAARSLGVAQPTIGRHMDALERELGLTLFTRSRSGFKPTEAALAVKPRAETMAGMARALHRDAVVQAQAISGTVRISASDVIGVEVLPPILAALGETHAGLSFELVLSDTLSDLLNRSADIAIRMAEPTQDALVSRRAGTIELGLYAHKRYLKGRTQPESLADLKHHRLIGFDQETGFIRAMLRRHPLLAGMEFAIRADSNLAQLAAIRAGAGIGFCQVPIGARDRQFVRVLEKTVALPLPCHVVMHEDLRTTTRYRFVLQALAAGLKRHAASR